MTLHCIFGQRACRYEGEYAPELLDACDWQTMEENAQWFLGRLALWNKALADGEFARIVVSEVEIDDKAFMALFRDAPALSAKIKEANHG